LLCALVASGCNLFKRVISLHPAVILYKALTVSYELDGASRGLPFTGAQLVTANYQEGEDHGAFAAANWARASLNLTYPHPEGKAGLVRATLRLSPQPSSGVVTATVAIPTDRRDEEIWILDLPRTEVDALVKDLVQGGMFSQGTPTQDASLEVRTEQGIMVRRTWSSPALEELMVRVYHEGWLCGFADCPCQPTRQPADPCGGR
jgi:hypothetical protein